MYFLSHNYAYNELFYTRAMLCLCAVCAVERWLPVCQSVTLRYCVKTAKPIVDNSVIT